MDPHRDEVEPEAPLDEVARQRHKHQTAGQDQPTADIPEDGAAVFSFQEGSASLRRLHTVAQLEAMLLEE